ncbi:MULTISPECIES: mechanosensitive ion channel family protein [unclassified Streptomyces]|uniref:mechanosensitive ion channel family protein n=1 Tax=unclassified Streptomyces TaxID=2593676 RepID=UPI000452D2F4|nr:mechanosensitive ion channel domain-containing protein [Streptomyces sp. PCS3-D2]WKV70410.1 mechanosensitive ion channel family protein [Streptomyces sp. PCS3-D2]
MNSFLRLLAVLGGSVVLTLVLSRLTDMLLRRADARHPETPLWNMLRRCGPSVRVLLFTAVLRGSYRQIAWQPLRDHETAVGRTLTLVLIGAGAWCVVGVASAVVESSYARYALGTRDPSRVRRVRTQVTLIRRIVTAVVAVVAAAAMLLTFPAFRAVGTSVLASAGLIGIVAGVAAQSTLGNVFAGFQIAFGDMVRIGDTVVVDGEWGVVEEVTLTLIAVRTWDERRITMPVSYFTSRPFENWSRGGIQMTGTVFLHCDHTAPVALMREQLKEILDSCEAWDGRGWGLSVTDTTPTTIVVRAIVTAKDPDRLWTARCEVRERLVAWLAEKHPYALPRVVTAAAVPSPRTESGMRAGAAAAADVRPPAG